MPIPDLMSSGSPSTGGKYLNASRLKNGPVKVTQVTDFISGFEGWPEDSKAPIRAATLDGLPQDVVWRKEKEGYKEGPKQFWACLVRNWTDGGVLQTLSFTQVSIFKGFKKLEDDPEWGELPAAGYAVTLKRVETKEKNGKVKVEYAVTPARAVPTTQEMDDELKALLESWVGLEALYHGRNPFDSFADADIKF